MSKATHTQSIEVPVYGPAEKVAWGWKRGKQIGARTARVTVYVDMAEIIRQLGLKAATNKSGRAKYMKGAVIIDAELQKAK
jgi:hypothetical protein